MLEFIEKKGRCWTSERAWDWYRSRPRLFGFNHVPAYAVNPTAMWQNGTFDIHDIRGELRLAADCGYNSTRVFLSYIVWKRDPRAFLDRLDAYLAVAAAAKLGVVFVLCDDCSFSGRQPYLGWQDEPKPGVHNGGWTANPGSAITDDPSLYPGLREYVVSVVSAFRDDPRVLFWDVCNEPGNDARGARSLYLLDRLFDWVRACHPEQPVTAAAWAPRGHLREQGQQFCEAECLALSDIITFHQYADADTLRESLTLLSELGYPIVCTEWFARPIGSTFATHLPLFAEHDAGCMQWGFVNGRTQTNLFPGRVDPDPQVWFHDVFHSDLTPYDARELPILRAYGASLAR